MAKKRKNTTKGSNKQSSNDNSVKLEGRGNTRSRKSQRPKGKNANNPAANDVKLRMSVEGTGDGNLTIIDMNADGNCLFRAVSDQLFWDYGNNHDQVRSDVCDFMADNEDDFAVFLVLDDDDADEEEDASDFETYVENMRQDGEWGGNLELVAAARIYRRKITVYSSVAAFTIEHGEEESDGPDMLVSFHDDDHYNSVRDQNYPRTPPPTLETRKGGNKRNKASNSNGKMTKQKGKVVEDVEEAYTTDTTDDSSDKATKQKRKVVKNVEEASTMDTTDSSGKTTKQKRKVVKDVEEASTTDTTDYSGKATKQKGKAAKNLDEASTMDTTDSSGKTTKQKRQVVKDVEEASTTDTTDYSGKATKQIGKATKNIGEASTMDTTDSSGKTTKQKGKVVKDVEEASTMDTTDTSGKTTKQKGKVMRDVEEGSIMNTTDTSGKATKQKGKVMKDVDEASTTDATISTTTSQSMSELTVKDGGETSNKPQKPVKKNSPCPCGSGQRYKKCCFAKAKHSKRVQKLRGTEEAQEEQANESSEGMNMKGNFRVLQI